VHKRARGVRTQDGDDLADGTAAEETPAGPSVKRLE
jgi:hypothetical protein